MGAIAVIGHNPIRLKKTQEPPVGELYCGMELPNNLTPLLLRSTRQRKTGPVYHDTIIAYQKMVTQENGLIVPYFGYVMTAPVIKELNPHALYPVAIFNATPGRLKELMCMPRWKRMPWTNDDGEQYVGNDNRILRVFHWVVENSRYVPRQLPNGGNDDGNWQRGEPIVGQVIINRFAEIVARGSRPLEYLTQVPKPNSIEG